MPVQFWNNAVLFRDGAVAMSPDCCCSTDKCTICTGSTPSSIDVDLSLVTGGIMCNSTVCDTFNSTTINCARDEIAPCTFTGYISVCSRTWTVQININSDGISCHVSSGCNTATYRIDLTSPYDCMAMRTLLIDETDFALCCDFIGSSCVITPKA